MKLFWGLLIGAGIGMLLAVYRAEPRKPSVDLVLKGLERKGFSNSLVFVFSDKGGERWAGLCSNGCLVRTWNQTDVNLQPRRHP